MSYDDLTSDAKAKFDKAVQTMGVDFRRVRTGRANPSMIEHLQIEAYDTMQPITQVASITVPEPTQLLIKPWDRSVCKAIEKAIIASDLGLAPSSDGAVIRLQIPPMSQERRKQLAAEAKEIAERHKTSIRNLRRDVIKLIETRGKDQKVSEDVTKKGVEKINELLKQSEAKLEAELKTKTDEILKF